MKQSPSVWVMATVAIMIATPVFALAETNDVSRIQGLDVNDIIIVFTSISAFILGVLSLMAYQRDGREKFLFVTLAFFIFASKGIFVIGNDLLSLQQPSLDIIAHSLDFLVLLCFFVGMIKK